MNIKTNIKLADNFYKKSVDVIKDLPEVSPEALPKEVPVLELSAEEPNNFEDNKRAMNAEETAKNLIDKI